MTNFFHAFGTTMEKYTILVSGKFRKPTTTSLVKEWVCGNGHRFAPYGTKFVDFALLGNNLTPRFIESIEGLDFTVCSSFESLKQTVKAAQEAKLESKRTNRVTVTKTKKGKQVVVDDEVVSTTDTVNTEFLNDWSGKTKYTKKTKELKVQIKPVIHDRALMKDDEILQFGNMIQKTFGNLDELQLVAMQAEEEGEQITLTFKRLGGAFITHRLQKQISSLILDEILFDSGASFDGPNTMKTCMFEPDLTEQNILSISFDLDLVIGQIKINNKEVPVGSKRTNEIKKTWEKEEVKLCKEADQWPEIQNMLNTMYGEVIICSSDFDDQMKIRVKKADGTNFTSEDVEKKPTWENFSYDPVSIVHYFVHKDQKIQIDADLDRSVIGETYVSKL
jgi:hypothetical protein